MVVALAEQTGWISFGERRVEAVGVPRKQTNGVGWEHSTKAD
jgi:hypothetical protein